jgi:hypothetical protein
LLFSPHPPCWTWPSASSAFFLARGDGSCRMGCERAGWGSWYVPFRKCCQMIVISTFVLNPTVVERFEDLYVAETGRILFSATAGAAISNATVTSNNSNLDIDGSVIGGAGGAISLVMATASDPGGNLVTIGQGGLVRSLGGVAIKILASGNSVANGGEIAAGHVGISLEGNGNEVINTGSIWSSYTGIYTVGDDAQINNSGTISAAIPIFMIGDQGTFSNSGSITASAFTFEDGFNGAVRFQSFANFSFINSGEIMAAGIGPAVNFSNTF